MAKSRRTNPDAGSGPALFPGTFLLALGEAATALNWKIGSIRGEVAECVDADGKQHLVGLSNLFRRARQLPREDWVALVSEFFTTVQSVDQTNQIPSDLAAATSQILLRLGPKPKGLATETPIWFHSLCGNDLGITLVVDYPNRMCYVTEDLIEKSGKPGEEWLSLSLVNLRARTQAGCFELLDEETGIRGCGVGDAYDSSRALLLEWLVPQGAEYGWLAALPGRDQLLVLPVNKNALENVHFLKILAQKNFATAPYPITEEVYWIFQGTWRRFPIAIRSNEVSICPPPEFADILRILAPSTDDTQAQED